MFGLILAALIAVLHLAIMAAEMFLWTHPRVRKGFGIDADLAERTRVMAANQGLYNGFLAAGLIWGLSLGADGRGISLFFLGCVFVAGVFGAVTVSRKILFVQAVPAFLAILLLLIGL